jgi:hypothetical protein
MAKIDLTKKHKSYFTAKAEPELVEFGKANFISITGKGDPSGKDFSKKIEALYPVAYKIKFDSKAKGRDFVVSKLEGLWWYDERKYHNQTMVSASIDVPRSEWEYRLLIRQPDFISENDFELAREFVLRKKNSEFARQVEYFTMTEGKCVQMLHLGPYSAEPGTLMIMLEFIQKNKLLRNGLHHEIYLSDFRKTADEKLKTILREPVK